MRTTLFAASVLALVSCGRGPGETTRTSVDGVERQKATELAALTVRSSRTLGKALTARLSSRSVKLVANLPEKGNAAAKLHVNGVDATVDMAPSEGARSELVALPHSGMSVFADVVPDADRVVAEGSESFEELWVLRSSKAPSSYRIRVEASGAVDHVELREGRIELVDATGYVRLSSEPVVAEDAKGVRRELALTVIPGSDPKKLEVEARLDLTGLAFPVVVDPAWNSTANMSTPRAAAATVQLGSGKILVAGGGPNTAELFDPATGKWSSAGTTTAAGSDGYQSAYPNAATLLTNGMALLIDPYSPLSDRYNPTTNSWTATSPLPADGFRGLAAFPGGSTWGAGAVAACNGTTAANVYNATTNGWATTTAMNNVRNRCVAVTLQTGRVLVVGGGTAIAEVYNPATKVWTNTGTMSAARDMPVVVVLPSGKVLAAGGSGLTTAELYDPALNTWSATGSLNGLRNFAVGVLTSSGKVITAGGMAGSITRTAEMYNPATGTWTKLPDMISQRKYPSLAALPNGQVLAAGGWQNDSGSTTALNVASAEIYGKALGTSCTTAIDCASGFCVDGVCCGTASCASGSYCNTPAKAGTCAKPNGTLCASGAECANGLCVDGVCCESTCTGQCQACDVPGNAGKCFPVVGKPHGTRAACTGLGAGTSCGPVCNGTDTAACHLPGSSASCGSATCKGGVETHVGTCGLDGKCSDVPKGCGAYACGKTACNLSCTTPLDCAAGYTCKAGVCKPADGLGGACASAADCTSGFCTDGVCCGVALCEVGSSCATAEHAGSCSKVLGTACGSDPECASGHCVDGVCCDSTCGGQCQACDVSGKFGTCSPVVGAPHGTLRAACTDGAGNVCGAMACDGVATDACKSFVNGGTVQCAPSKCEGDTFTGSSTCDSAGTCVAATPQRCVPYKCDNAGCRTGCTLNEHCVDGYVCKDQVCVAVVATCSPDAAKSIAKDGTTTECTPYLCGATGSCGKECASSTDCASGFICNAENKTCVAQPTTPSTDDGGGCSTTSTRAGNGGLLLVAALGMLARRRRR